MSRIKGTGESPSDPYYIEGDTLKRKLTEDSETWGAIVLTKVLTEPLIYRVHDMLGHNGTTHTYLLLCKLYFWKGMKNSIANYISNCSTCQKRNQQVVKFAKSNFEVATFPMEFISMDLIGELYPPSKSGHKYALIVICMLAGNFFCIPLRTKFASEVVQAYIDNVYAKFGGHYKSYRTMAWNLKTSSLNGLCRNWGLNTKSIPPYCPSSNGCIEGFHNFLKPVFPNI